MAQALRLPCDEFRDIKIDVYRAVKPKTLLLPVVSPSELLPYQPIEIKLIDVEQVDGNTTLQEQIILLSLAKQRGANAVFEFGTFDGKTTANLAANLGAGADILTIDLPAADANSAKLPIGKGDMRYVMKGRVGAKLEGVPNVRKLYGDTARFDFSPWYGTRDFIFIDACHEYEYVRNDTEIAMKLLKPSGIVAWHDYGEWVGVTRALNEFQAGDPRLRGLRHVRGTTLAILER